MKEQTEIDFRNHAAAEYPRECCGLVVVAKGKERYLPCRNIAESSNENFVLHPEDYAAAEDLGDVLMVAHSHPDGSNRLSPADHVMLNASGLPWCIVAVDEHGHTGPIAVFDPDGYEAPLVGRPFAHGVLDCYALIRDYYDRELRIELPNFERQDNWWNKGGDLYMQHFRDAGFEPIKGAIQLHDVVIMQVRSPVPNHAGVYIGDTQILHHMYGRLSTREVYGGYYHEITRMIVRHQELAK